MNVHKVTELPANPAIDSLYFVVPVDANDNSEVYVTSNDGTPYNVGNSLFINYLIGLAVDTLEKSDVGLGNVDNTSDALKPISDDVTSALTGKSNTGHSHALASLDTSVTGAELDADHSKLGGVQDNAKDDQSGTDIKDLLFALSDTNNFDNASLNLLAAIISATAANVRLKIPASGGYLNNGVQTLLAANFGSWVKSKPFITTALTADGQEITKPTGIVGNEAFEIFIDNTTGYTTFTLGAGMIPMDHVGSDIDSDGFKSIVLTCQPRTGGDVSVYISKETA